MLEFWINPQSGQTCSVFDTQRSPCGRAPLASTVTSQLLRPSALLSLLTLSRRSQESRLCRYWGPHCFNSNMSPNPILSWRCRRKYFIHTFHCYLQPPHDGFQPVHKHIAPSALDVFVERSQLPSFNQAQTRYASQASYRVATASIGNQLYMTSPTTQKSQRPGSESCNLRPSRQAGRGSD